MGRIGAVLLTDLIDPSNAIVSGLCEAREADAPLFMTPKGKQWSDTLVSYHFQQARLKAKAREILTPHALRHLWISEALMAGLDTMIVARVAGTSTAMVERVYGQLRAQGFSDAQARLDRMRSELESGATTECEPTKSPNRLTLFVQ